MIRAYECRKLWAKPYFYGVFCANMCSTQRSESANMVLKNSLSRNSSLNSFITQCTKLTDDRDKCR